MKKENIEIERKYIISMPKISDMKSMTDYTSSDIVQIYLESLPGVTHRIRSRKYHNRTEYTETKKIRIDKMSAIEEEDTIDSESFELLSKTIREGSVPITKTRHTFIYLDRLFEIDVYPEWKHSAIMETELPLRDTEVSFPNFINVIREVTGDRAYSNAGMSIAFPKEEG